MICVQIYSRAEKSEAGIDGAFVQFRLGGLVRVEMKMPFELGCHTLLYSRTQWSFDVSGRAKKLLFSP